MKWCVVHQCQAVAERAQCKFELGLTVHIPTNVRSEIQNE